MDNPSASLALGILGAVSSTFATLLSLDTIGQSILMFLGMDIFRSAGRFRYVIVFFLLSYTRYHINGKAISILLMYEYDT